MNTTKSSRQNLIIIVLFLLLGTACGEGADTRPANSEGRDSLPLQTASMVDSPPSGRVLVGAEVLLEEKLDLLRGKRLAIAANHTALIPNGPHLVDTLVALGMDIRLIYSPEHGFRGTADAGKTVKNSLDEKTGIPIRSLYGKNKKPSPQELEEIDMILFDIQDVGARFYTYISTMTYLMEACADAGKQFMVLDRPNPNGWYVDGPMMKKENTSFVGLHEIPTVHGMTVGEYAKMVNVEDGWMKSKKPCILTVIPCRDYRHEMKWEDTGLPWVAPSPNLKTEYSAYLYPMLCWFEGMPVSVGRGMPEPFTLIGAPWHVGYKNSTMKDSIMGFDTPSRINMYGLEMEVMTFRPTPRPGALFPKFEGEKCYGIRFLNRVDGNSLFKTGLQLLANFEEEKKAVKLAKPLFEPFFTKLVGNKKLKQQIEAGVDPEKIHEGWQRDIGLFKSKRAKYLLYP